MRSYLYIHIQFGLFQLSKRCPQPTKSIIHIRAFAIISNFPQLRKLSRNDFKGSWNYTPVSTSILARWFTFVRCWNVDASDYVFSWRRYVMECFWSLKHLWIFISRIRHVPFLSPVLLLQTEEGARSLSLTFFVYGTDLRLQKSETYIFFCALLEWEADLSPLKWKLLSFFIKFSNALRSRWA